MKLIDGKEVANHIKKEIKEEIEKLKSKGVLPGLAVVIVGENPASQSYVRSKQRTCERLGMHSEKYALEDSITEEALLALIDDLNQKADIHGILVQLPLPKHINEMKVIEAIDPKKDVDGFHPVNVGKLAVGHEGMKPCTPYGIIKLLEYYDLDVAGKEVAVLGRSNIVGKPAAMLLLQKNATVTICHSRTQNLKEKLLAADVLVVAIGKPHFVTADMVKEGAIVIDVGINRVGDRLVGDVDFDTVKEKVSYITPVPGGVGPMTIAMLMHNTLQAAKNIAFDGN